MRHAFILPALFVLIAPVLAFPALHGSVHTPGLDMNLHVKDHELVLESNTVGATHTLRVKVVAEGNVFMLHNRLVFKYKHMEFNIVPPDHVLQKISKHVPVTARTKLELRVERMYISGEGVVEIPVYVAKKKVMGRLLGIFPVEYEVEVVCPAVEVNTDCEVRAPFWRFLVFGSVMYDTE